MSPVSAYIPCYNNVSTIKEAIASLKAQTVAVSEIFVIDDGSEDDSAATAKAQDVYVIRLLSNRGRGAVRALAMKEASNDLVLCCDANKVICPNFVETALPWLDKPSCAGIRAHIIEDGPNTALTRWRARHLFRTDLKFTISSVSPLITSAALLRKSAVIAVGNYKEEMRHSEDRDLGERLTKAGYHIGFDPSLWVKYIGGDSLGKILDRYWRWTSADSNNADLPGYLRSMSYCLKELCAKDLQEGDLPAAAISLLLPHYQYARALGQRRRQRK